MNKLLVGAIEASNNHRHLMFCRPEYDDLMDVLFTEKDEHLNLCFKTFVSPCFRLNVQSLGEGQYLVQDHALLLLKAKR